MMRIQSQQILFGAVHRFENKAQAVQYLATSPRQPDEVFIGGLRPNELAMVDQEHGRFVQAFDQLVLNTRNGILGLIRPDQSPVDLRKTMEETLRRVPGPEGENDLRSQANNTLGALFDVPAHRHQMALQQMVYRAIAGFSPDSSPFTIANPRDIPNFMKA